MISGWTPLMAAASGGSEDCTAALLSAGANHAHADRWGRTPLHLAAGAGAEALPCAELLLHAGADAFVEDIKVRSGPPYGMAHVMRTRNSSLLSLVCRG